MSTVEPAFGQLTQQLGLRKINTIGLAQANKCMHLAAIAYNLKKLLKFTKPKIETERAVGELQHFIKTALHTLFWSNIRALKMNVIYT